HGRAHDEQDVAQDGADDRRLDDLLEALAQGEQGDDELGGVAEGDVEEAADAGAGAGRQLLGGPPHQGRGGDDPEGGREEDGRGPGVDPLQEDGQGDERHQQVRPAVPAEQESPEVEAGLEVGGGGHRRLLLDGLGGLGSRRLLGGGPVQGQGRGGGAAGKGPSGGGGGREGV